MNNIKIKIFICFLGIISIKSLSADEQTKGQIPVKFGTLAPEGSIWMTRIREVLDEVNQKTNNKFKVTLYSGGVLGDEPDMVRKMRLGQLQMAAFTISGIQSILPEMSVLELPFLFEDLNEVDYIRKRMFSTFSRLFESKGFVLLLWVDQGGFLNLFSTSPVRTPDELARQKVWTWSGDIVAFETLRALGVTPLPVPLPEVITSLQTGMLNTFFATPLACVALQWFAYVKYATVLNMRYEPGTILATKELWDSIPAGLRESAFKIIQDSGEKTINAVRLSNNRALMNMTEQGIKLINLKEEEKNEFRRKTVIVYGRLADKVYSRELLDQLLKNIDEYRREKKHE